MPTARRGKRPLLLVLVFLLAACLPAAPTAAPAGYPATLAAQTLAAMEAGAGPAEELVANGPTATLPKAATATPRATSAAEATQVPAGSGETGLEGLLDPETLATSAAGLIPILTDIVGTAAPLIIETDDGPFETAAEIGAFAPDFDLPDAHLRTRVRLSALRGQPVMLNFWTTWCTYCETEMPAIEKAYQRHATSDLVVLGINVEESKSQAVKYGDRLGLSFNLLLDSDAAVSRDYRVATFPTSYFIGRDGVITSVHVGEMTPDQIEWYISMIIE